MTLTQKMKYLFPVDRVKLRFHCQRSLLLTIMAQL